MEMKEAAIGKKSTAIWSSHAGEQGSGLKSQLIRCSEEEKAGEKRRPRALERWWKRERLHGWSIREVAKMERQISETELGLLRNDKRAHLKTIKGGFQDTHLAAGTIDKSISSSRVGRFRRWKRCKTGTNFLGFRSWLTIAVRSSLLYFGNDQVYILNLIYWIIFSY